MICSFNNTIEKCANGKAFISWLVPSFSPHDLRLVVFGTLFGQLISVMNLQDKFASLWQVNSPNSQNKFQIIMVYRHVFDMIAIAFRGILCVFVNFVGFCGSLTAQNIRSPGIQTRLETTPSKCPRRSKTLHILNVSQIQTCFNMRSMSFKTGKPILYNFSRWWLFLVSSYCRRRWK